VDTEATYLNEVGARAIRGLLVVCIHTTTRTRFLGSESKCSGRFPETSNPKLALRSDGGLGHLGVIDFSHDVTF
jgi:hypothetical protein